MDLSLSADRRHAFGTAHTESPAMTIDPERRQLLKFSLLAALPGLITLDSPASAAAEASTAKDFDFFMGKWQVRHRRLKQRLAGSTEWEEYDGTTHWQPILGGIANFNDSVVNRSTGTYRGMGLRAFDARTNTWTDWYLDGRDPTKVSLDGTGRFVDGVGTFFSDDTFEGKSIKVRGIFKPLGADAAQWEQAFSPDGGQTWETNYVMHHKRIGK
jgi:hypothetical protein